MATSSKGNMALVIKKSTCLNVIFINVLDFFFGKNVLFSMF